MSPSRAAAALVVLALALTGAGWATPAQAAPPASTTTLVLSSPTSVYGQTVTATAQVVLPGGLPEGDVLFILDGASIKANLKGDGSASIVLPRTLVGEHPISARFVQFPDRQQGSESATTSWVVTPVRTNLQVRVTGRGAHVPTSVVLGAAGDFGTLPAGTVTVTARRLGTGKVTKRTRTLDGSGAALARFGILRTGTYRLRVAYVGDGQHLAELHSEKFAVRQR